MTTVTEHDLIEIAKTSLLAEMKASQLYTMAIGRTDDPEVKRTLQRLIKFEDRHVARLLRLFNEVFRDTTARFDPAEFVRTNNNTAIDRLSERLREARIDKNADVRSVLKFAVDVEHSSRQWYESMADRLDDERLRSEFQAQAKEEKAHETMLRRLLREAW